MQVVIYFLDFSNQCQNHDCFCIKLRKSAFKQRKINFSNLESDTMTGMRRNENQPPKGLQCEWCCAIRVWLTYLQGKVTTQQCCVGKNWVIKFPPFPESVPEEYLFSECNPDFSASNKTQMKLFWGGASQQCQPYSSSLVQRQQRSICVVTDTQEHTHTHTFYLFQASIGNILIFFHSQNTNPRVPQTPYLHCS